VGIVTEPREDDGIRHEAAQLLGGTHGVPLAGDEYHGRACGGQETRHVRRAHGKHGGIESHGPAAVTMLESLIPHGVWRQQARQPGEPEMPLDRLVPGRVHGVGPRRERPRAGQLLAGPHDLDAQATDSRDWHAKRTAGEGERHDATERVAEHDEAARRSHGVSHRRRQIAEGIAGKGGRPPVPR